MVEKFTQVEKWLSSAQESYFEIISSADTTVGVDDDKWTSNHGGYGRTLIFQNGKTIEKFAVNSSSIEGNKLPPAASSKRPDLAGLPFRAVGLSIVFHQLILSYLPRMKIFDFLVLLLTEKKYGGSAAVST